MNKKDTMDREISLSELFWGILLGWRRIICCLVVFALLTSIAIFAKDTKNYKAAQDKLKINNHQETDETELVLTKEEKKAMVDAYKLIEMMDMNRTYTKESKLMNINPYAEQTAIIEFYVNSGYTYNYTKDNQKDYVIELVNAYCSYIQSDELVDGILENNNIDLAKKYISELISANSTEGGIFQITVIYDDEEILNNIVKTIEKGIQNKTASLAKSIGNHTITLLSQTTEVRTDLSLALLQKQQQENLNILRSQLNVLKGTMSEEQINLLNETNSITDNEKDQEDSEDVVVPSVPSISIKYCIFGAILGIFLACLWTALQTLFNTRIQTTNEIKDMYGLRIFGEIKGSGRRKKFIPGIDDFILKLKNRNTKQMSQEQQLHILCSNIEIACNREEIKNIYLTGSEMDTIDNQILQKIKKELEHSSIAVRQGYNINYDAKSLKEMADVGNVIFVEQANVSLHQEISNELRVAKEQAINILGAIAIN